MFSAPCSKTPSITLFCEGGQVSDAITTAMKIIASNIPVFKAEGRTVGRTRLKYVEDGENNLREFQMRR
jgi:hypothetical protein